MVGAIRKWKWDCGRARELVVLMAKEFQPYGATWAELMHKSGLKPTAYKRALEITSSCRK